MDYQNDDISKKQHYLKTKIIDEGYDPKEFNDFMCNVKNEESIDLSNWTLQEIVDVVNSFKEYSKKKDVEEKRKKEIEEKQKKEIEEKQKKEIEEKQKKEKEKEIKNKEIQKANTINTSSINTKEPEIRQKSNLSSSQTISSQPSNMNNPFTLYEKFVKCEKLEPNQITNRDDLYITISEPKKIKEGFFSKTYYQYIVKTFPVQFNVIRKLSDFYFLSQKLPLIHPVIYIPEFPSFPFGLQDDSPKKMRFIQNYMNLLIENRYLRSLPIVYDFLTLPQVDWNNKVKNKYNNIKEARQFNAMPNFDGQYYIKISKEDEKKASNIKKDINLKTEIYNIIDEILEDLLSNFDTISYNFSNLATCFKGLKSKYNNNNMIKNAYGNLYNLFKMWSEDYKLQKNLFRNEVQYFFLFINKELNTFLKNCENYRLARDDYTNIFEKFQKNKNPVEEDFSLLKSTKKYYAYELTTVNNEYKKLEERHKNRLLNQFMKYNQNINILFQDFKKILNLFNFQELSDLKGQLTKLEGEKKEVNKSLNNKNQENNDNQYIDDIKIQEHLKDNNINNNIIINNDNNVVQEKDNNNLDNKQMIKNDNINNISKNENKKDNNNNNDINDIKFIENEESNSKDKNTLFQDNHQDNKIEISKTKEVNYDNEDKTVNKIEKNLNENNIEDLKENKKINNNITNENLEENNIKEKYELINENKEENNKDINENKEENKNIKEKSDEKRNNNIENEKINEEQNVNDKEKNKIDEEKKDIKNNTNEENKNI